MATNSEDISWLYGKLKAKGYDIGSEQEFTRSLANEQDRRWYYDKASGMGLQLGSMDDFNSLFAPRGAAEAAEPEQIIGTGNEERGTSAATPAAATQAADSTGAAEAARPGQNEADAAAAEAPAASFDPNAHLRVADSFRTNTAGAVESVQRLAERGTQAGRDRLRAAKFGARLAGAPTRVLGLSAGGAAEAALPEQNGGGEETRGYQSRERVVPYGVKYVDGKPVTEWLLPDGRTTMDLTEADAAEHAAGGARLNDEFEKRMRKNHLLPGSPDHRRRQAILDRMEDNRRNLRGKEAEIAENAARDWEWDESSGFFDNLGRLAANSMMSSEGVQHGSAIQEEADADFHNLIAEHNMLAKAKERDEAGRLRKSRGALGGLFDVANNFRNIGRGIADVASDANLYIGGLGEFHDAARMDIIKDKVERGQELSDSEYALAYAAMLRQEAEAVDVPHGYTAGGTTVAMLPFMLEMAANPASGLSKGLAKKFGSTAVKRIALRVGGDIAESAVLANTLQAPATIADIRDRHRGDVAIDGGKVSFEGGESWGAAIRHGEAAMTIEDFTEKFGEYLGPIFGAAGRGVKKVATKAGMGRVVESVSRMANNISASEWGRTISNIEERAQWNGIIGEVAEEEFGIPLNAILVGDNKLSDLTDAEQQVDIVLGVGLFGGFVSGIKTAGYPVGRARAKHKLQRADTRGNAEFGGDSWTQIRGIIDTAEDENLSHAVTDAANRYGETQAQQKLILEYAKALVRSRGYNLADAARRSDPEAGANPRQELAGELYSAGQDAYERSAAGDDGARAEVDEAAQRMREAYATVEEAFGGEAEVYLAQAEVNPWPLFDEPLTDEQKAALLEYVNCRAAIDGVTDATGEALADKRVQVEADVNRRMHKNRHAIIPARMKVGDAPVYVVKGEVAMFADGSGVDARNSSDSVIVLDETGNYRFVAPEQIASVGESLDPVQEIEAAYAEIAREHLGETGIYDIDADSILAVELPDMDGTMRAHEVRVESIDANGDYMVRYHGMLCRFTPEGLYGAMTASCKAQLLAEARGAAAGASGSAAEAAGPEQKLPGESAGGAEGPEAAGELTAGGEQPTAEMPAAEAAEQGQINGEGGGQTGALSEAGGVAPAAAAEIPAGAPAGTKQATDQEVAGAIAPAAAQGENAPGAPAEGWQPQATEPALARIPVNEQGEPAFETVDAETGWDGLVEAVGDEGNAEAIAQAQVRQATAELEALGKRTPKPKEPKLTGSPMAMARAQREAKERYNSELAAHNERVAAAQARMDAWKGIVGVRESRLIEQNRREEEERRQRDAAAHDEAAARFEEQQRIKAEREAEQERIGTHAVHPKIKEKWDAAPKIEGNSDIITLPDGSTLSGRYVLVEAGAATASHDANNGFVPTDGFPVDENGQSVNDRDYQRDADAQQIVMGMADNYDNRALQDPVVVSQDGVVLSGNNRTMSGDLAASRGTDRAYVDYLAQLGHRKYGFRAEQVAGMQHPRVLFVPDEALPYDATTFARFNAQEKKSQSKPEAAVKLGKTVPDNVFAGIVETISRYDRLSDFYADERAVAQTLGMLMQAGVINERQLPEFRTGTALSAAGRELIENMLIGKAFQASPDAVRQIIAVPTLRQAVVMALNEIAGNRTLAESGYDISEELAKAVDLVARAKAAEPEVYANGMPVSPFGRQQGLFDDEFGDSSVSDATTLLLADTLNSAKPSDLRKVLATYNESARQAAEGQIDMFSDSVPTKEEILTQVIEHFRNATPKEQQALVDAAIAERKRRAEAGAAEREREDTAEQAADADGSRGEGAGELNSPGEPSLAAEAAKLEQKLVGEEPSPEEEALAARIEVTDNEWEEGRADSPTYKREITIDGSHKVTQVDAPDADGLYSGSYFEFGGKRFGSIAEVAQYIDGGMQAEPSEAQKAAGNYKMDHRRVDGYNISIENPKGSVRRGTDADGKPWETTMQNDYGYIRGTEGVDGDHIDVFLSDTPEEGDVFVVDQVNEDGSFDEHKVMYGFPSEEAAREAYLSNYEQGWPGLGAITRVSKDEFKKWIQSSRRKTKPFAEYRSVKAYQERTPHLSVEPDGFGDFGPVFTQFKGNASEAIKLLTELQTGEAIGALHHREIGDIDLVWGETGTSKSDGYGLAKLIKFHPEVVENLQEILDDMHIVKRSENRINLESETHKAAVRLTWNRQKKKWLLTAFEKKETSESIDKTTDTDENPLDLRGGTTLSQNSDVSDGKGNALSSEKQEQGAESSDAGPKRAPRGDGEPSRQRQKGYTTIEERDAYSIEERHTEDGDHYAVRLKKGAKIADWKKSVGEYGTWSSDGRGEILFDNFEGMVKYLESRGEEVDSLRDKVKWAERDRKVNDALFKETGLRQGQTWTAPDGTRVEIGARGFVKGPRGWDFATSVTYPDGRKESTMMPATRIAEFFKANGYHEESEQPEVAEAKAKPVRSKKTKPEAEAQHKIEDFGEEIAGARKDMLREFAKSMDNVTVQSLIELPLGKVFKRPNLKKMVESGAISDSDALLAEAVIQALILAKKKPALTKRSSSKRDISEWAEDTYNGIRMLADILSGDQSRKEAAMARHKESLKAATKKANEHIARLREWNPDKTIDDIDEVPDPVSIILRILEGINHRPGEKVELPLTRVELSQSGRYEVLSPGKQGALWFKRFHDTKEEAIETAILAAKLARGDMDVELPENSLRIKGIGERRKIQTGKFKVLYWGRRNNIVEKLFDTEAEAKALADEKNGRVYPEEKYLNEYSSYTVAVTNPLTGESHPVGAENASREELADWMADKREEVNQMALSAIHEAMGTTSAPRPHFYVTSTYDRRIKRNIYSVVEDNKNNPWPIVKDFASRSEAEAWLKENLERLEQERKEKREAESKVVYFQTSAGERIGKDRRNGKPATPEMFTAAFGFRGVQFGNWTNASDRQMALNQAYDAFMDLAETLGLSPRAMSLDGELALAFGARGNGSALAHYEPNEVVINLTKTRGVGSLAHEWLHALDNFLARRNGVPLGYVTHGNGVEGLNPEVGVALKALMGAVKSSEYYKRSVAKGDYWGRPTEVMARLFASWIADRFKRRDESSPFLAVGLNPKAIEVYQFLNYLAYKANELRKAHLSGETPQIMSEEEFNERPESLNGYPYPIQSELETLSPYMEEFFNALSERESSSGSMANEPGRRYSRTRTMAGKSLFDLSEEAEDAVKAKPEPSEDLAAAEQANSAIDRYAESYNEYLEQTQMLEERLAASSEPEENIREQIEHEEALLLEARDELQDELRQYYVRNNTPEDAEKIARDMTARTQFEVELQRNKRQQLHDILSTPAKAVTAEATETSGKEIRTAGGNISYNAKGHLPDAKTGEFAYVERQFSRSGEFSFTGNEIIRDCGDVAYMFRTLEDYSIEHTFAILVKDGRAKVLHLGMGSPVASVANLGAIRAGYEAFGADKVYFVHNHPSGNLMASVPDMQLMRAVEAAFDGKAETEGIIIDTTSGRYKVFNGESGIETAARPQEGGTSSAEVLRFDRAKRNGEATVKVSTPADVSNFIAEQRFGKSDKVSYIVLSNSMEIIGNFHTDYKSIKDRGLAEEMASVAIKFGGNKVIVYGNVGIEAASLLRDRIQDLSLRSVSLLDAIEVTNGLNNSAMDKGLLGEDSPAYGAEISLSEETGEEGVMYRDGAELSDGERLRAIRALEPIEVERNDLSRAELREVYNNLPAVEKDGRQVEFYRSAFKKIYKDGSLFGQVVPVLDEVLEQSVLAYSEEDNLGGTVRPDGSVHKKHPNVGSFDNYVGKVNIDGKEYYVRTTVQRGYDGRNGTHSFFVTDVSLYEKAADIDSSPGYPRATETSGNNSAEGLSLPITTRARGTNDGVVDAKLQQFFERASSEANLLDMRDRVEALSESLGVPVRVVTEESELSELTEDGKPKYGRRQRRAKGWFSEKDNEIVIVLPNNVNVADVDNTFIHEVVGHRGLRALVVGERFDAFLDEVYGHASNPIRRTIDGKTDEMVGAEADRLRVRKARAHERAGQDANAFYYTDMAEARVEAEARREEFRREATEEYMADLSGRIGSEGFARIERDELTLWGRIKARVQAFLDKFLRGLNIPRSISLTDKDLSYILYKSWKNLRDSRGQGGVFADAEDAVMRRRTGWDEAMQVSEKRARIVEKGKPIDSLNAFSNGVAENESPSDSYESKPANSLNGLSNSEAGDELPSRSYKEQILTPTSGTEPTIRSQRKNNGLTSILQEEEQESEDERFRNDGLQDTEQRGRTENAKATADRIETLFNQAVNGDLSGKPVEVGRLTPEGKAYLEQLSGMQMKDDVSFLLNPSDLVHIYRRHFGANEKDSRNIPLTNQDIRHMAEIISTPDRAVFGKEVGGNERNMFFFLKGTAGGSYNLMEVYSDKRGNLTAKSFFKSKEGVSQRAMLLNESSTLTSVTDGATLFGDAKLPKFFEYPTNEEEDSDGLRFRDGDLDLEEYLTKMKVEAMQANANSFKAKKDAMRAIGGNLNHLRQAMAHQREYDITTVKSVADLARILLDNNLLDDLSKYETKRILSAIQNSIGHLAKDKNGIVQPSGGKKNYADQVHTLLDIMVDNQLRLGANALGRLLSTRGSRVDARGIEVQGELDADGQRIAQVVRKSTNLPKEDIDNRIAEATNRMSSTDQAIADEAAIEYAGLQIARQYVENITESKAEEKELRDSIEKMRAELKLGHIDKNAFTQYREATEEAIRQNKIERAEAYYSLVEQIGGVLSESVERAKAWREAEKQRVEEIHHNANSDMESRPADEHHKESKLQKLVNNSIARLMLAPLATFDQMLRMFGKKNSRGEGYLWNRYMRGWVSATEKEYIGYRDALKVLDAKVSEIYGKKMTWSDLFGIDRKLPKATVRFFDGGEMKDHLLTQGNLLYIYMADKMSDGRMKLRRMGITEEDIERIKAFLDPHFIELADWMQEEFLVDKRNEYNEVHKRMFGASMAAIENYFPLKILANARIEEVDVAEDTTDSALPATTTGSIIKRKRNNLALDVTGANAFSVILDHLQQMERWAAFAEFNRDLNTLLSYKRFRNQVMNMSSIYGSGKTLWKNFRDVCRLAAGAYRPPIAALDKAAVNLAKGVTAAKVSLRVFTALKQFLSMPAYVSDCNPVYLAANIANPYNAWRWSLENLPLFDKRWRSRMAGDPRLLKTEMDWKMWRSHIVEIASRVGMSPNAFVDALTVAIGSHAMYQTKLAKYKRMGYDPDVAEERAKQDATILFNQTQQSSEGAFLSTMQVDRSWPSVVFTVFRNSSMAYSRQLYDAIRNIVRRMKPGYKERSIEFMTKQMVREGIDPDRAERNVKQEYRRGLIRDLVRVGIFGFALQFAWNLGAYLPYLIFGDDDETEEEFLHDVITHAMFGGIEGLTGGDVLSNILNTLAKGEKLTVRTASKDMPMTSDLESIISKWNNDEVSAMNDVINLFVQSAIGVNPQTLTDAVVAVMDYCGDDAQTSRECAILILRILNCPQSQIDKIYFDELGASGEEASRMTPREIAERYARYKVRRGAPLTGWAYGEEQREEIMTNHRKKGVSVAKDRLARMTDAQVSRDMAQWLEEFEATKERLSNIRQIRDTDEERYYEQLDAMEMTPEFRRYEIIKWYKYDIDELTHEWLTSTTPAQRDSCVQSMIARKRDMVSELVEAVQQ